MTTEPDYIRMSRHQRDLDDDGHDITAGGTPVLVYAECNSPPSGSADFDFDTFYDVDQADLSGVLPVALGLSYASGAFTADEDGVWAVNIAVNLTTTPGEAGEFHLTTDMYSLSPIWYVSATQVAGRRWTASATVVLKAAQTFALLHNMPTVQAADYASMDIIRLARSVS